MSKVTEAFSNSKAFIPFLTAGDPNIEKTENYILELEKAGADLNPVLGSDCRGRCHPGGRPPFLKSRNYHR